MYFFSHSFWLVFVIVHFSLISGQFDDGPFLKRRRPQLIDMLGPLNIIISRQQPITNSKNTPSSTNSKMKPMPHHHHRRLLKRGAGVVMPWRELCALAKQDKNCFFTTKG